VTLMLELCSQCGNRIAGLRISLREVAMGALCGGLLTAILRRHFWRNRGLRRAVTRIPE
jgi:hypothetical protein